MVVHTFMPLGIGRVPFSSTFPILTSYFRPCHYHHNSLSLPIDRAMERKLNCGLNMALNTIGGAPLCFFLSTFSLIPISAFLGSNKAMDDVATRWSKLRPSMTLKKTPVREGNFPLPAFDRFSLQDRWSNRPVILDMFHFS